MSAAKCVVCEADFLPVRPNQLACGPACRKERTRRLERAAYKRRYAADASLRAKKVSQSKTKWATDAAYRGRENERRRSARADDRESRRVARTCPRCGIEFLTSDAKRVYCGRSCLREEVKRRNAARNRLRYQRDPGWRAHVAAYQAGKIAADPDFVNRRVRKCRLKKKTAAELATLAIDAGTLMEKLTCPRPSLPHTIPPSTSTSSARWGRLSFGPNSPAPSA